MLDQKSPDAAERNPLSKCQQSAVLGTVYSYTLLQEPPAGYESQAPYYIALVALDDGGMVTAQLTDLGGCPGIGDRVEMVTRKLTTDGAQGMIVYGYKFRQLF